MSVKITELPILDSLADNDIVAGVDVSGNVTSKIEMATLKNYIDTNTQYTAGTNIDITNNVISAPDVSTKEEMNSEIEKLQNELDAVSSIYNAFPTESDEDESMTLDGTAEVKFKKFDLKGNTSQNTYTGKNKFATPINTTASGITLTNNSDGSITLNGTATNNVSFSSPTGLNITSGNYVLSYTSSVAVATEKIQLATRTSNATRLLWTWVTSTSGNVSSTTTDTIDYIQIVIMSGTTLNNFKIYIQLESGSTPTNFEPYVGGTASPNPDYPQPVNVVSGDNEINVVGKNILENTFQSQTANGITFTRNDDGSLSFSGTATQAHSITGRFTNNLVLRAGTSYIFSLGDKQAGYGVYLQQTGNVNVYYLGVIATNSSLTITPTEDTIIQQLAIHFPNGNTVNGTIYPMLEVGSSATEYEPYQGNTYNIDLPVENLVDTPSTNSAIVGSGLTYSRSEDGTISVSGTSNRAYDYTLTTSYTFKAGETYTFYCERGGTINVNYYMTFSANNGGQLTFSYSNPSPITRTMVEDQTIPVKWSLGNNTQVNYSVRFMIQKGSKANSYTPYGTTPIELCKIGNYQDYFYKDSGKWYLHKEIGKAVLNGSENWNKSSTYQGNYYCQSTIPYAITFNVNCFSNLTNIFWNSYTQLSNGDNGIMLEGGGTNKTIDFKISSISTLADFKTFLSNNNLILYYVLATPTNTEITYQPLIDQLNLLEKAQSKENQTNISQVNNDLGFIIYAEAIKSLQNVLDRIELLES